MKAIAGLVAVAAGLVTLVLIALLGIVLVEGDESVVSIATASFGVIGTIVGAYFGVKLGTEGTKEAIADLKDEAARAQSFAAYMQPEHADKAADMYRQLRHE